MKHGIAIISLVIASASLANVRIPETTPDVNAATLYAKGEGAYAVVSEARSARLYVGGNNGEALSVVDPSAIRGEVRRVLGRSEIAFDKTDDVTQTGDDSFSWSTTASNWEAGKSWFRIVARDGGKVDAITFDYACGAVLGGIGAHIRPTGETDGRACKISLEFENAVSGTVVISNLVVYRSDESTKGNVTDAVLNKFYIKDTRGKFDLGTLRQSYDVKIDLTANYRWSECPASNTVSLAGFPLVFDESKTFFAKADSESMGLYAGGGKFMSVAGSDADKYANVTAVSFDAIDASISGDADHVRLVFTVTHTGSVDTDALVLLRSDELSRSDGVFYEIPYTIESTVSVTGGTRYTILCGKKSGATQGFYKIAYGTLSSTVLVQFNAPVLFSNGLRLRGDDGKTYAITVTDGVLSATAVTE